MAIGDSILDLDAALAAGLFEGAAGEAAEATRGGALNAFFALGKPARVALRQRLLELLGEGAAERPELLHPAAECQMHLPARIGDYTDFYVGIRHAENVGKLFRPDNPLLPNYKHVPIGYHGRASTVRVSGSEVRRPNGQTLPAGASEPVFGPCARLDYELELGIWIGQGNALGEAIRFPAPPSTSPASACSTTGRRATSRPGNTNRSARSCRRASSPASRPGWSPPKPWSRSAVPSQRAPKATRGRCRISTTTTTRPTAPSTSSWRSCCSPRACARKACRRSA